MSKTTAQLLSEVEDAISSLLGGAKEYRIGNRTVVREDLDVLLDARDRLKRQKSRESSSPVRLAKVGRPRPIDR